MTIRTPSDWYRTSFILALSVAAIYLLPGSSIASVETLPQSFEEAIASAKQDKNAQVNREYHSKVFMPFFDTKYITVINQCIARVAGTDKRAFSFVVALDKDGKVVRVYRDVETAVFLCLNRVLSKETFPRPPMAPYLAQFVIPAAP